MATIQQYKKSDGTTAWLYKVYMGKDPLTGKEKRTTRRGFKTKKGSTLELYEKRKSNYVASSSF